MMEIASRNRIAIDNFQDFLDMLNQQAYILKKGKNMYQVQLSYYSQIRWFQKTNEECRFEYKNMYSMIVMWFIAFCNTTQIPNQVWL